MKLFGDAYRGRRVLVTGHTGFKGSWLTLWLEQLGAEVTGIALAPDTTPNHWSLVTIGGKSIELDIRDAAALNGAMAEAEPEIVFHLAAQPLVRKSYRAPLDTWSTNVMGTANVLEACRHVQSVHAIVAITTDKCYENREWVWGYRENDQLGGHDPYSASKAGAELVAMSYRRAFFDSPSGPLLATARAGNVVGGGDWSEDRLIPDAVRAVGRGEPLVIRSPKATRPWQHVLECLSGYLMLGEKLLKGNREFAQAWNFGPEREGNLTVSQVLDTLAQDWAELAWSATSEPQPHESGLLCLDSTKAHSILKWTPVWSISEALAATAAWYRAWLSQGAVTSRQQISEYVAAASSANAAWVSK